MKILKASRWKRPVPSKGPERVVRGVIEDIRKRGFEALKDCCRRFDGVFPRKHLWRRFELETFWRALPRPQRQALKLAAKNLRDWARCGFPEKISVLETEGMRLERRLKPLASVAVYVPGGRHPLVSSVLMGLVPARVAGVKRRVLLSPAPGGRLHPALLAAAFLGGAHEVWAVGGAQGVAAAALGAGPFEAVDKIVGPGNAFVTEAKRQLSGKVAIDMLAGPSEILIILDDSVDPEWVVLDLLAQAEHGPDSLSLVLSYDRGILEVLARKLRREAVLVYGKAFSKDILKQVFGLLAASEEEVVAVAEAIACEHLQVLGRRAAFLKRKLNNYGTLFCGPATPVALGDYISGANHVLPTGGGGRFRGGLDVRDFLVSRTIQSYRPGSSGELYRQGAVLARLEGLKAHEMSLERRLKKSE
jgi:histidinol dehydrogenase